MGYSWGGPSGGVVESEQSAANQAEAEATAFNRAAAARGSEERDYGEGILSCGALHPLNRTTVCTLPSDHDDAHDNGRETWFTNQAGGDAK